MRRTSHAFALSRVRNWSKTCMFRSSPVEKNSVEAERVLRAAGFFLKIGFKSEARRSRRNKQPSPVMVRLTNQERQAPKQIRCFLPQAQGGTTPSSRGQLSFKRWCTPSFRPSELYTQGTPSFRRKHKIFKICSHPVLKHAKEKNQLF